MFKAINAPSTLFLSRSKAAADAVVQSYYARPSQFKSHIDSHLGIFKQIVGNKIILTLNEDYFTCLSQVYE